ncbi:MAG TPA: cytochrome C oxidase subunit I, partial [Casimicrobiaceae bacterium]|nr:cytochrome C oxidase subunit I [Casimicrobiaceae bacterium]
MHESSLHHPLRRLGAYRAAQASAAAPRYRLDIPAGARRTLARRWLGFGLAALIAAGVLSILLVLSRTPGISRLLPIADFFQVALVAHVDLSVLVWFCAFAGVLWTLNSAPRGLRFATGGFALVATGTAAMALAPFAGAGRPVMANYIPVLDEPIFLGGLVVLGIGVAAVVLRGMATSLRVRLRLDGSDALRFGLNASLVATAVALLAFAASFAAVPASLAP